METVSLSKAAELTGKSKSTISSDLKKGTLKGSQNEKKEWEINKNDLFALYPEKEQQKCERLEKELQESKNTILALKEKLNGEISKREALELLVEQINKKTETNVTKINIKFHNESDPINVFLREHIDCLIKALEPFSSSTYPNISPSICLRLVANYNCEFDKFKKSKEEYKNNCRNYSNMKSDTTDKFYKKFIYSITNEDILDFITKEKIPTSLIENQFYSWVQLNFKFQ